MQAILTINTGSTSVKADVFSIEEKALSRAAGINIRVDRLSTDPVMEIKQAGKSVLHKNYVHTDQVLAFILEDIVQFLQQQSLEILAVSHRVVHGGSLYTDPVVVTDAILDELKTFEPLAPLHQPYNLLGIRLLQKAFPHVPQIACFDTAFHQSCPMVNQTFALPAYLRDQGIRAYGFHGLSYESIMFQLDIAPEHLVIAHLGAGVSMCAVKHGKSIATSMGFSALEGLPMATRCGQLDPGVLLHLMEMGKTEKDIEHILYKESGLLGLSGLSGDVRDLLASDSPDAEFALKVFVKRIVHYIGAMVAELGGFNQLIFTGGIGENAAPIRDAVVEQLSWLFKMTHATVRVLPCQEDYQLARHAYNIAFMKC